MGIDNVFVNENNMKSFEFNENVCNVFDDMVSRSVPGYENIQDIISLMFDSFSLEKVFLDVGCSTGTTINKLLSQTQVKHCYGVDVSECMLEKAKIKCDSHKEKITLSNHNYLDGENRIINDSMRPDFVILNLVLQFIRPPEREVFIKNIKSSCSSNVTMIVFEKIIFEDPVINTAYIDSYLKWKYSRGYSKTEIENKRLALENKLIPYLDSENIKLFKRCGFNIVEHCFSFLNFRGYLCRY